MHYWQYTTLLAERMNGADVIGLYIEVNLCAVMKNQSVTSFGLLFLAKITSTTDKIGRKIS